MLIAPISPIRFTDSGSCDHCDWPNFIIGSEPFSWLDESPLVYVVVATYKPSEIIVVQSKIFSKLFFKILD